MGDGAEFDAKVAVITGAAQGIGAATAALMASRGAAVAVLDRNGVGAHEVAGRIDSAGGRSIALECDVSDEGAVTRAFGNVAETFGGIDILVANHTVHGGASALDTELFEWDLQMSINLKGTLLCARAALPTMIERGGGVVIAIGSDCVIRSCRNTAPYMTSKAGLIGLIRSIAIDFADRNVRANIVTPGVTDTPGVRALFSEQDRLETSLARSAKQSPFGRVGHPNEVAEMIAFACSPRASFVTGTELIVDGGMTLSYSAD